MSEVQSWQIQCRRCGWANSGAEVRCGKCGYPLPHRPGMLVAGQSSVTASIQAPMFKVAQPAGFWVRLVALILDLVILNAVGLLIFYIWQGTLTPAKIDPDHLAASLQSSATVQVLAFQLAVSLVNLLYFAGSWTILGATPAQKVFNLHVIGEDGQPIGFMRGVLRYFILSLLGLPSAIVVMLSKSKRGLHDRIARTFVIQYLDPDKVEANAAAMTVPAGPAIAMPAPRQALPGANPMAVGGTVAGGAGTVAAGAVAAVAAATQEPATQAEAAQAPAASASEASGAPPPAAAAPAQAAPTAAPLAPDPTAPSATPATPAPMMTTRAPVPPPQFPMPQAQPAPAPQPIAPLSQAAAAPPPTASQPMAPVPPPAASPPLAVPPPPIDAMPPQAFEPEPYAPPPATELPPVAYASPASAPASGDGREIYSPEPGTPPAPPTIDPYPLPFAPAAPEIPPPAPPPHYAEEPPPA